jgi:hypothetical protein
MKRRKKNALFDKFSMQALQTLHRYRAVMFSPTRR